MTLLLPQVLFLLFGVLYLYLTNPAQKRLLLVLGLMIVALARPAIHEAEHSRKMQGREALIALDLSYSMRADDITPSRLEAAKETIRSLVDQGSANRYALYGFTTNPLILSPYTTDGAMLTAALDAIDAENILTKGTSIGNLLSHLAHKRFPAHTLILFSDGGDEQDADRLIAMARRAGIRIIGVGMATRHGAMLKDPYGQWLKQPGGALVVSRINPVLKRLSKGSGGLFIPYRDPESTAAAILKALDAVAQQEAFVQREAGYTELYWIPLAAALLLFFFHFVALPGRLLALLPFLSLPAEAWLLDWHHFSAAQQAFHRKHYHAALDALERIDHVTLQSKIDEALLLYKLKRYRSAAALLSSLQTTDAALKQKILFLLGNCEARMGQYSKAAEAYRQALKIAEDPDIRYNLKLVAGKKDRKQRKPPAFKKRDSDQPIVAAKSKKKRHTHAEASDKKRKKIPTKGKKRLGYKAYELINKGYIDEKRPW